VAVVGRRAELLRDTVDGVEAEGGLALAIVEDLEDPAAPQRIVAQAIHAWGRLDVLVNNAAYILNLRLEELTRELIDRHYAINVRAQMLLLQSALPALRASPSAAVVNISSSSASLAIPGQSMYGMTKAAVEYLTRSYAAELAADHIRVNCIAPGPVDTPIHLTWARTLKEAYVALEGCAPLHRIAQPDELAKWVEYLVRPDEAFVTGAVFAIDAGQTLNGWNSAIGDAAAAADEPVAGESTTR
jgi:NAD(P)-dependent dehydrogenase (short-subunit alcohol dehydrogenase family)